jgi:hypothetical protein
LYFAVPEAMALFLILPENCRAEEKRGLRAAPERRSVGELLSHIARNFNFQHQMHAKERWTTQEVME